MGGEGKKGGLTRFGRRQRRSQQTNLDLITFFPNRESVPGRTWPRKRCHAQKIHHSPPLGSGNWEMGSKVARRGEGLRIGVTANQFCWHQQRGLRKVLEYQISHL